MGRLAISMMLRNVIRLSQAVTSKACVINHQPLRSLPITQQRISLQHRFNSTTTTTAEGETSPPPAPLVIEHIFIRFDYKSSFFSNALTVSMPENTPVIVVNTASDSLHEALQDRPTGNDYSGKKLVTPEFVQTGLSWNRYMWKLVQREVEGSLDPYIVQGIVIDAIVNRLHAKVVGSTSLGDMGNESFTYIIGIPVQHLDYSYKKTVPQQ